MSKRHLPRSKVKYYSSKRRAVYAKGDQIDHLLLFELYMWKCWLCNEPINKNIRKPNYLAATVDHVIPLCAGGTHTWDNLLPAHAICNFRKGESLLKDSQGLSHGLDNGVHMMVPLGHER